MTISKQYHHPWETPLPLTKRISWKLRRLMGRNARFKIGKYTMDVPEDQVRAFFDNGDYYERNITYWLEKILVGTKNRVFYDVGANYGYYCLKFASNASQIYAFEPVSRTHDVLVKNIQRNNLTNITAYKLGLSDQKSSREIYLYGTSTMNSLFLRSTSWNPSVHPLVGQEVIDLVTLDDLIQDERLNPPDLMKIDVEGGELYVLKGARKTIKKYQPVLLIEYVEAQFKDAGYSNSDLLRELMINNYAIYGISKDIKDLNIYPMVEFDNIEVENIIALPKSLEHFIGDAIH
jgi:FkbM family methyltransferase